MSRRLRLAIGLFFLAPLVGEFLLGNLPITLLSALVVLAPLYGGGALLIRETARRKRLSWPWILVLCLAYGIVEEAFATQSLFNPNYLGMRLLDPGYVAFLGMGAWWTVFVLSLHTIWSTAVPIALMETVAPSALRRVPWLRPAEVAVTAVLFVAACVAVWTMEMKKGFVASVPQLLWSAVVVAALVGFAVHLGAGTDGVATPARRAAPRAATVAVTSLLWGATYVLAVRSRGAGQLWVTLAAMILVLGGLAALVLYWSGGAGWSERHRLGLCSGLLLTYAWYAFVQPPVGNVSPAVDLTGNAIFALGALALLFLAVRRVKAEAAD